MSSTVLFQGVVVTKITFFATADVKQVGIRLCAFISETVCFIHYDVVVAFQVFFDDVSNFT